MKKLAFWTKKACTFLKIVSANLGFVIVFKVDVLETFLFLVSTIEIVTLRFLVKFDVIEGNLLTLLLLTLLRLCHCSLIQEVATFQNIQVVQNSIREFFSGVLLKITFNALIWCWSNFHLRQSIRSSSLWLDIFVNFFSVAINYVHNIKIIWLI